MKLAKVFFLALTLFLFMFSNLFSQPEEMIELLNRNDYHSIPHEFEKLDKMYSKDDFVNHRLFYNLTKSNFETIDVVDSIIAMNSDGSLEKFTYTCDSNGNMTSEL